MNLYKAFLSMVLIGMVFGEDIEMEEINEGPQEIVGGKELSKEDRAKRPFLANVGWNDPTTGTEIFACGGSVISPSAILTAAHCVRNSTDGTWYPPHWIDFFRYDKRDAVGTNGIQRYLLGLADCVHHSDWSP
jgi:V8-like Glu-specific endopeptidase